MSEQRLEYIPVPIHIGRISKTLRDAPFPEEAIFNLYRKQPGTENKQAFVMALARKVVEQHEALERKEGMWQSRK